jgi:hypothetical protein
MLITQVGLLVFFGLGAVTLGFGLRSTWRREDKLSRLLEKKSPPALYLLIAFEGAAAVSAALAAVGAFRMIVNMLFG